MEGLSLQHGMSFRSGSRTSSTLLMSVRPGAPYQDKIEDNGRVLIYEGHDAPRGAGISNPKLLDQPEVTRGGAKTPNGKFYAAAQEAKTGRAAPELVRVFEKVRNGLWVYLGAFLLTDSWREHDGRRFVFKFKLELTHEIKTAERDIPHTRLIPSNVIRDVWERDGGRCVRCGSTENLHFDHMIPFSKGGASVTAANIQLLCASHNLSKGSQIGG